MIDTTVRFVTDAATLAAFDPAVLEQRINDDPGWWCEGRLAADEVRLGKVAIVGLGGDGIYQARITDGELTDIERDYAAERIAGLGLEVASGQVFIGPGECLPGGGQAIDETAISRGTVLAIACGRYLVDIFAICWHDSPVWWRDDGVPDDAPSDFVLRLRPAGEPMERFETAPRFTGLSEEFLFPSASRRIGPESGMLLKARVIKHPTGKLGLAACGPGGYRPELTDYANVSWRSDVRIRVLEVDHNRRTMTAEFVERA